MTPSDIRHLLHQHPGLSGQESYAHDLIVRHLTPLNPTHLHQHVGGYGVVAFWGDSAKPCVAIRADIDALPINETTPLEYQSQCSGVSHKCGHDGHTAILLRTAQILHEQQQQQMLLIFQPAEETGQGAQQVIDSGVLEQYDIKHIYGIHNLPGYALGEVVLSRHTFAAASTGIIFHLKGRQTHASTPEKGLNPGLCVAQVVEAMQQFNTGDKVDNADFGQSTLICIRLGDEAFGTSAGEADVMFTLRAFTNSKMEWLTRQAIAMVQGRAERSGLECSYELREPFRATENDSGFVDEIQSFVADRGCSMHLLQQPFRWSEDFANYLQHYKGALFGIGAGENMAELHHPNYDFPDEIIEPTAQLFVALARHLL